MLRKAQCVFVVLLMFCSPNLISTVVDEICSPTASFAVKISNKNLASSIIFLGEKNQEYEDTTILKTECGKASYYAKKFHNRNTASGEVFDLYGYTAAHKKLPFGTIIKVKHQKNGKAILLRINDRGPFCRGRIVDLTYRAAKEINGIGIPNVEVTYLDMRLLSSQFGNNYYAGYSQKHPFMIVKKNIVLEEARTDDFEAAINMVRHFEEKTQSDYYIFVCVGENVRNAEYVIGTLDHTALAQNK